MFTALTITVNHKISNFKLTSRLPELREEIHLQRSRQFRRGGKGNVHIRLQHLRNVGARNIHPLGQCGLVEPELFHPAENLAEEYGADMVNGIHELKLEVRMLNVEWRKLKIFL